MRSLIPALILSILAGCVVHPKVKPTPSDTSHAGGSSLVQSGSKRVHEGSFGLKTTSLTPQQKAYADEIDSGAKDVDAGNVIEEKAYDECAHQIDSSRQWLFKLYDGTKYASYLCLALGLAAIALSFWNGSNSAMALGVFGSVIGASGIVAFSVARIESQLQPWFVAGGAVIICAIVALILYFLYDRYIAHKKLVAQDEVNKEVVMKVAPTALKEAITQMTPTAQGLLKDAKAAVLKESQSDTAVMLAADTSVK